MGYLSIYCCLFDFFFFSSRRRHTRFDCDWSSDVCSSDLPNELGSSDFENFFKLFRVNKSDRVDNDHRRQRGLRHQLNQRGKKEHCCQHDPDRKSTRLNSSHSQISYAVFCLKKKKKQHRLTYMLQYIIQITISLRIIQTSIRHETPLMCATDITHSICYVCDSHRIT